MLIIIEEQNKVNNEGLITSVETEFQTARKVQEIKFLNAQNASKNQLINAQKNRILIISLALALISSGDINGSKEQAVVFCKSFLMSHSKW